MSRITVLGMEAQIAQNLLKQGHAVTVWNRSAQKTVALVLAGAEAADTPRAAVKSAEFVISMVRDDEASQQVWLADEVGALDGLSKNAIALESSTLTVDWTRTLAQHFQKKACAFLDAPVAGSLPQAESAQLIYFVGGEKDSVERVRPVLNTLGSAVHYAGAVGNAMAIKLAVNALFSIQTAALGELITFMRHYGLESAQAVDILTATPVCSSAADALARAIVARKFGAMFPIELVEKDLSYLADSQRNQLDTPISKSAHSVFQTAVNRGYGADNITGVIQLGYT